MFRTALALGSVAILLAAAGCSMCCHQYDDSGPVYSDDGSSSHQRAGSILAGSPPSPALPAKNQIQDESASPTLAPAQAKKQRQSISYVMGRGRGVQGPALGQTQPGDVSGSERVVSVTDHIVKSSDGPSKAAEESSLEPSQQLPATGWTARRPTTDSLR